MKPGDMIKKKDAPFYGLFMGMKTFGLGVSYTTGGKIKPYTCAEVMWFDSTTADGGAISTIQADLIEVVDESNAD